MVNAIKASEVAKAVANSSGLGVTKAQNTRFDKLYAEFKRIKTKRARKGQGRDKEFLMDRIKCMFARYQADAKTFSALTQAEFNEPNYKKRSRNDPTWISRSESVENNLNNIEEAIKELEELLNG